VATPEFPAAPGSGKNVVVVVVAGGSGSGKSVFCGRLQRLLEQSGCAVVTLAHDSYYKNGDEVEKLCDGDWDSPLALNTDELLEHMQSLGQGSPVAVPHFDFGSNKRDPGKAETVQLAGRGVVLVEGLLALHDDRVRKLADLKVFVDCDEDIRFMRRLARDTDEVSVGGRGRSARSVYRAWANCVKPAHHQHVEPCKRFADIVVPSTAVHSVPNHLRVVADSADGRFTMIRQESHYAMKPADKMEPEQEEEEMWPALYLLQRFISSIEAGQSSV